MGMAIRMWRAAKRFTLREMTEEVNALLPETLHVSQETIRKYEQNEYPRSGPNPVIMAALAAVTGHPMRELPETVQLQMRMVIELGMRNTCYGGSPQHVAGVGRKISEKDHFSHTAQRAA